MAQQGVHLDRDKFCCSICLDLLKDPVTIHCGHSYCMGCIQNCWDQDDQKGISSCPQCGMTFSPRPVLKKNNIMAEVVEQLRTTGLQAAPPDHCYAGPGDVACDFCPGRKQKALKSCLVCLTSFCETHLQPHYTVAPLKKHKLVNASSRLQENICSRHHRITDVFCHTDQLCICYLCSVEEHKGHSTVSAAVERTERQKELGMSQQRIQQRVQGREKDVKVLEQEVLHINHSADRAVRDSERICTELMRYIQARRSEVKKLIRAQQRTAVTQTEELQERLEQEIVDLRRRDTELEQLSHIDDHVHFLQSYLSLSGPSEPTDLPSVSAPTLLYFAGVTEAVSDLRVKLEAFLTEQWPRIPTTVNALDVLLPLPEPKTRDHFLQYSFRVTLDPNTANTRLCLSEGNRKATLMSQEQSYPDHPERFIQCWQVLSTACLTGRCYWEVEWSRWAYIAVSYKDISRTGSQNECGFGYNPKSWALDVRQSSYRFRHNNITTPVSVPRASRTGVYLDHKAGILSFYSVSDTMTLLHRVNTTFTEPLYAGLWLPSYDGGTAELC